MIKTIIIDDEASAINVLSLLLKKKCKDDVEVIATTTSPSEGRSLIEQHKPDLVFLDIEMPGLTGIDLIRSLPNPNFHLTDNTISFLIDLYKQILFPLFMRQAMPDRIFNIGLKHHVWDGDLIGIYFRIDLYGIIQVRNAKFFQGKVELQ